MGRAGFNGARGLAICLAVVAWLVPTAAPGGAIAAPGRARSHTENSGAVVARFVAPEKVKLEPQGTTVGIDLTGPAATAILQAARGSGRNSRVYLTVQGIEYEHNPGAGYEIYLNVPPNTPPQSSQSAGVLHFYGLKEAAQASGQPAAMEFDITDAVRHLIKTNHWNNRRL